MEATIDRILREYDLRLDASALKAALRNPQYGPGFAAWIKDNLGSDNLLSKDELTIYTNLQQAGLVEALSTNQDLSTVLSLDNDSINRAIAQLNESTSAIRRQTDTLNLQKDALDRLIQAQSENAARRAVLESDQLQQAALEFSDLNAKINELAETVDLRIKELQHGKMLGRGSAMNTFVSGILESDDKLFSSLQQLGWELETDDPEEDKSVEKLRETCARLIKSTVESIRTKLDRIFLQSVQETAKPFKHSNITAAEVKALEDEVETLFSEIMPVAQMSVEKQYLEPALKSLTESNGKSVLRTSEAIDYINRCLDYMLNQIERLSDRIVEYQIYADTTAAVVAAAQLEATVTIELPRYSTFNDRLADKTFVAHSPLKQKRPAASRQFTVANNETLDSSPLEVLLDHLAISLASQGQQDEDFIPPTPGVLVSHTSAAASLGGGPGSTKTSQISSDHIGHVVRVLNERTKKTFDVTRSVQATVEKGASAQVADARRAVQMLRDELLAETPFGTMRLIDPEMEGSIAFLRKEVEDVKQRCVEVEAGVDKIHRSEKREEFVKKWR